MELCKSLWEASYDRGDNAIYYPKEEVVKFLNRHVRKRTGLSDFRNVLEKADGDREPWRALDYGCGIGRHTILLEEFGFEAWGVDLSDHSISFARKLAGHMGFEELSARLSACDGKRVVFDDGYFDICLAESCMDCMPFELARQVIGELDRVTKSLAYITLYSGDNSEHHREFAGELEVSDDLARGTIRSFYNWQKIQALVADTRWAIRGAHLVEERSLTARYKHGRYYIVLTKR